MTSGAAVAWRLLVVCVVALAEGTATGEAQVPVPTPSALDRSVHVTIYGEPIREADLQKLVRGLYEAATTQVHTIKKQPSEMPVAVPYVYFAGREAGTGHEVVWETNANPTDSEGVEFNDEYTSAYALAAIDDGLVGNPWESLYRTRARDDASRIDFAKAIARMFRDASEQQKVIADADIAWIRKNVLVGTRRQDAYAALRSYGLVAFNSAYIRGVPIGDSGCDYTDLASGAWPYPGESLPKQTGGCAAMPFRPDPGPFPTASITLHREFSIACSSEIHVTIGFDNTDRVKAVEISKPEWVCV